MSMASIPASDVRVSYRSLRWEKIDDKYTCSQPCSTKRLSISVEGLACRMLPWRSEMDADTNVGCLGSIDNGSEVSDNMTQEKIARRARYYRERRQQRQLDEQRRRCHEQQRSR